MSQIARPLSNAEADALAGHESVIASGLQTFVEVGRALLAAEPQMSDAAFGIYCEQMVGHPAATVRPILDLLRDGVDDE